MEADGRRRELALRFSKLSHRAVFPGVRCFEIAEFTLRPSGLAVLHFEPVVWEKGKDKALPSYGGDPDRIALAINDYGQVAGASVNCSTFDLNSLTNLSPVHALLWDNGKVTNLDSLGGAFGKQAHGMNNRASCGKLG